MLFKFDDVSYNYSDGTVGLALQVPSQPVIVLRSSARTEVASRPCFESSTA